MDEQHKNTLRTGEKPKAIMALDLSTCGIGNIVLMAAAHKVACDANGVLPVLFHDAPEKLGILDESLFDIRRTPDDAIVDPDLPGTYCNLKILRNPAVVECMRKIVKRPPLALPDMRADAGFCFRVSIPELDYGCLHMTEKAIDFMIKLAKTYARPYVCSNDKRVFERVLREVPNAVGLECTSYGTQNHAEHIMQWLALSACPVVYHGIGTARDGSITTTFAPTAAAYGGTRQIAGITNFGVAYVGKGYAWNRSD